jgi:hypothetical protein
MLGVWAGWTPAWRDGVALPPQPVAGANTDGIESSYEGPGLQGAREERALCGEREMGRFDRRQLMRVYSFSIAMARW